MNDQKDTTENTSEDTNELTDDSSVVNNPDEDNVEIIYKKEKNPVVKFLLGFLTFVVIAYIVLFATGFIMGLMGIHPPTIDNDVFVNQWEKVSGEEQTTEPASELETKDSEETSDKESNTASDSGGSNVGSLSSEPEE